MINKESANKIIEQNNLEKGKFLFSVGNMYLNNRGVDCHKTNNDNYYCLVVKSGRGTKINSYGLNYITKSDYEALIDSDSQAQELANALRFCGAWDQVED